MRPACYDDCAMSWERYVNWTIKALLVLLLLIGLLFPDLPRFDGKAWPLRAMTYPLSTLVVPLVWFIKKPGTKYPHLADTLLEHPAENIVQVHGAGLGTAAGRLQIRQRINCCPSL